MTLIEDIYHQRRAFLRRNTGEPNLLLVPYEQRHQLLGELVERFAPISSAENIHFNGMKLVYVNQKEISHVTVAISVASLK